MWISGSQFHCRSLHNTTIALMPPQDRTVLTMNSHQWAVDWTRTGKGPQSNKLLRFSSSTRCQECLSRISKGKTYRIRCYFRLTSHHHSPSSKSTPCKSGASMRRARVKTCGCLDLWIASADGMLEGMEEQVVSPWRGPTTTNGSEIFHTAPTTIHSKSLNSNSCLKERKEMTIGSSDGRTREA